MKFKQVKWLIVAGLALCAMLFLNLLSVPPVRVVASNHRQASTDTPTPTPTITVTPTPTACPLCSYSTYHTIDFDGVIVPGNEWSDVSEKLGKSSTITYYVTWNATYLYAGIDGGNTNTDRYNLVIDTDPNDTGVANFGTLDEFCGATFGANGKPNYAVQKLPGTGVRLAKVNTPTVTPTPTSCGFDNCRPAGSPPQKSIMLTPTPQAASRAATAPIKAPLAATPWSTWTPASGQTTARSSTNQVEFRIKWTDLWPANYYYNPLGLYLYVCNSSNRVWSVWPPSNLQSTGVVQELSSRVYLLKADSGRLPRDYAQQWGEQTVFDATGPVSMLNGFAQFNITAGGGAGCQLTVQVRGNAAADRDNSAVRRVYDIIPTNCPGLTTDLRLKYLDGTEYESVDELNGAVETDLHLFHWNGSSWTDEGGTVNTISNTATRNDISSFSPWTFDDGTGPTAITLTTFSGRTPTNNGWIVLILLAAGMLLIGGWALRQRSQL